MLNKIQLFMFSVFLIGGLIVAFISLKGLYHSHQASSWNSVPGKIKDLKIHTSSRGKSPNNASTSSRHLKYSYEVELKKYIGSREYFGLVIGTNNETTGGYLKDSSVKVYYDPKSPINSVLKPQNRRAIWFGLIMGFVLSGFGAFGVFKTKKT